jgi:hypothetical protein
MKKIAVIALPLSLFCSVIVTGQNINHWETAVFNSDTWSFHVGNSDPGDGWRSLTFDDSLWPEGPGGFGYGDNDDNTIISPCSSVFLRIKFTIPDISKIESAILSMDYDDGFVAYLNDKEIARIGVQGIYPAYDQYAEDHEAAMYQGVKPESFFLNKERVSEILMNGENILAVQVHNSWELTGDLSSNVWLSFGISEDTKFFRQIPDWFIPATEFKSSNLPIVSITTPPGQDVMDEPKITSDMKIIQNGPGLRNNISDPGNVYSGKIGIEIRGRYSASLPQRPYGVETRDETGNNLNIPILGMPAENDWVLTANYNDKSFLRNFLAFDIFRKMGHYAPRSIYCEVVLNGEYQGIYLLGEKIKQDKNRVDIAKLNPDENSGDGLTGGYIFATDYYTLEDSWLSNFSPLNKPGAEVHYVYVDPKPGDLTEAQKAYLSSFVDSFEGVLYSPLFNDPTSGYLSFLDVRSFVDYFLLSELTRNVDAYKKSRFFYKDKDSKDVRIHSGPPWDYDWAWKDITEHCINFNQTDGSGWAYLINECEAWPVPPSWELKLLEDQAFANEIHHRYNMLRKSILSESSLFHVIDSVAVLLDEAQERHYKKWQILGINVGTEEYGEQPDSFGGEIEKFKNWIQRRLNWLDANMVGEDTYAGQEPASNIRIFPNPAREILNVETDQVIKKVEIFTLTGVIVKEKNDCGDSMVSLDISILKPGLYIIHITLGSGDFKSGQFIKY